ncbi:hypothetical protein K488DRAFT_57172 [Vararia minispora EC-137]|uniref:Uncharacterized protein n=1 Tax=Vararia minispora EC-137 TaxID=1314806 RepID=A0ACB8QBC2_9AGAM|nr:hypothetical protein K488DRAFT_57172 [Vararia minispora EC-137]
MPVYQLFCVAAHSPEFTQIQQLVRRSALHVMDAGGVVRGFRYFGVQTLSQRMRAHSSIYHHGDIWSMHFDASPSTQTSLFKMLKKDPSVIRPTILKMGDGLRGALHWRERTIADPAAKNAHELMWTT